MEYPWYFYKKASYTLGDKCTLFWSLHAYLRGCLYQTDQPNHNTASGLHFQPIVFYMVSLLVKGEMV